MASPSQFVFPEELRKRILFTLGILIVYRVGVHVPVPGVDGVQVVQFFQKQSAGIFGLFNTFTGGALEKFSIFALGIMPYISASIIFQLLQAAIPALEALKKEGEHGRKKINQYTRYATIVLAIVQGYALSNWLSSSNNGGIPLVSTPAFAPFLSFKLVTIITLTAGTAFIMWLGEQIDERGIGRGSSMIIFSGIAASIPGAAIRMLHLINNGEMGGMVALLIVGFMVAVIGIIVYIEAGQRRIPIHYSQRAPTQTGMGQQLTSHLPLKLNFANVIPPIFASSLLMFPATMAQFIDTPWMKSIQQQLTMTSPIYLTLEVALIVFFSFFYTEIVFNPDDVADNLKKYGGFIPGIRAGKSTSEYIQRVLDRLTVGGCIYLSAIVVLPTLLINQFKTPFYFGGTSLLILVGVAMDTSSQIQSHLLTARYEGLMKGVKMRGRRVQY